jgi:hypothetical protein
LQSRRAEQGAGNITHQSVIRTTFLLYRSVSTGMMVSCGEMGAVSIIGR